MKAIHFIHQAVYTAHRGQTMVEFGILGVLVVLMSLGGLSVLGPPFANAIRNMTDQGGGAAQPGVANVQAASNINASATPYNDSYGPINNSTGSYGGGDTSIAWEWDGTTLNGAGGCAGPDGVFTDCSDDNTGGF